VSQFGSGSRSSGQKQKVEDKMTAKLTFKVESAGKPYAVMVLRDGLVTARMGRALLSNALLAHALQWVKERNPRPSVEPHVSLVGRFPV
jgi:hypothetical protein